MPVFVVTFYLFFYILQERELRHFIQEMRITKRQKQTTKLFDSQSEGILVVQKGKLDEDAEEQDDLQDGECIFCNSVSREIFGLDLSLAPQNEQ